MRGSASGSPASRFPLVLTLVVALALALLVGLGVWQLRRLAWKEALLAHVAALRTAPARPIGDVLAELARGGDVDFIRVSAECGSPRPGTPMFRYALDGEQVAWRPIVACPLSAPPYDGVLLDRGLADALTGIMAPRPLPLRAPAIVTGVLRKPAGWAFGDSAAPDREGGLVILRLIDARTLGAAGRLVGLAHPAPVLLEAERETPPPPGVTPRALPAEIPNNHLAYALTWFALAAILIWFYGALLVRRMRGG